MTTLQPGTPAPDFTLVDQDGDDVSLHDLRGRNVILFFYPAAMTPGCTTEACDFRDSLASLTAAGYADVGISPDPLEKLHEFAAKDGLPFALASDEDHAVAEAYGAWGEKKNYGKTYMGIVRSAFLVGPDGALRAVWYKISPKDTPVKLLAALEAGR